MTKQLIIVAITLATVVPGTQADTTGVLPVGQTEYEFVYDRMEHTATISCDKLDYQLASYRLDMLPPLPMLFSRLAASHDTRIALFGSFREDIRSARFARETAYESIRGGLAGRPSRNLFVYANFTLDEQKARDPNYTGKTWRGLAGDVEQAFATYQSRVFTLQAGRFSSFWGPRNSLVLGSNAILDGLAYSFRWGRAALSYRFAKLDGLSPERNGVASFENRYLAGHRLDIHLSNRLRVGFSEMVIFGGPGRQPEFAYLNPILFYHSSQLNDNTDDNTLLAFDFDLKPVNRLRLYGQLLIDDFQIEKKTQADQEPNEYGVLLGAYVADVMPNWDIKAEYSRVTNWTYNQPLTRNRYILNGKPITAARGNDYDLLTMSAFRWLDEYLRASLTVELYRQGEGSPNAIWSKPWLAVPGDYHESFPTGVVERELSAIIGLKGFVRGPLFVDAQAGVKRVSNYAHLLGDDRTVPFFSLLLSAFFSTDIDIH